MDTKDEYRDLSTIMLIPTRGEIAWPVYVSHMAMEWPINHRRGLAVAAKREVGDAYCKLFADAVAQDFKYAITIEDDMVIERDVVARLHAAMVEAPMLFAVSALYHTRDDDSHPIILGHPGVDGDTSYRSVPEERGLVEVNAIPMGCALWNLSRFYDVPWAPWFVTTATESQDIYFCLRARERGLRFAVDTRIEAGHHDRETDKIY